LEEQKERSFEMVRSLINRSDRSTTTPFAPLSRVFEHFFDEPLLALMPVPGAQQHSFALDLSEDESKLIVRATLPGFSRDEVNVEVDDGILTISGEHSEERTEGGENEKFYRRERRFGSVQRRIALPVPVREEDATADLKDGVLTLRIPKVQKAPAKKIAIGEGASTGAAGSTSRMTSQPGNQPRTAPR
jgi:HSP20 family protein